MDILLTWLQYTAEIKLLAHWFPSVLIISAEDALSSILINNKKENSPDYEEDFIPYIISECN